MNKETDKWTDRPIDRQTDRLTDKQTETKMSNETDMKQDNEGKGNEGDKLCCVAAAPLVNPLSSPPTVK